MATARLTDSQKQELVRRFRQGESTQALADHFGCSTTTITRLVRAELSPEDYAALRDQRQRKAGRDRQIPLAIEGESEAAPVEPGQSSPEPVIAAARPESVPPVEGLETPESGHGALIPIDAGEDENTTVLAIDDADDFAADDDSEDDLLTTEEEGEDEGPFDSQDFHAVAVLPILVDDQHETRPAPWTPDVLPSCAYLLVDKTVELQARPLADIPELGRLPAEEQDQQALVLFTNPRQAKRQCGRTQRVIKLPDPALLGRTAPYLRAQGISRVVIEGALYALPGGH
jgi:hypothetical protein